MCIMSADPEISPLQIKRNQHDSETDSRANVLHLAKHGLNPILRMAMPTYLPDVVQM